MSPTAPTSRAPRPVPSLRAQALAFLSRRDYSRLELRRRLLEAHRRRVRAVGASAGVEAADGISPPSDTELDEALDWLEARGYLSDERFVESRLNARAARHGTLRIQGELARHGVALSDEQAARLRETELARAREVWQRRFGQLADNPRERARQARFLASRGFAADVVRRIVGGDDDT